MDKTSITPQADPEENSDELEKLRKFYRAVAELTLNHDVLEDHAVVYPRKLASLLEEIDPKWYVRENRESKLKHYHAHIYWENAAQRDVALSLREDLRRIGGVLGSIHDRPIGPHPLAMYQVEYDDQAQGEIENLLKDRAGDLSVLLHDDTGEHERDHTEGARWIGKPLELDIEFLRALEHD